MSSSELAPRKPRSPWRTWQAPVRGFAIAVAAAALLALVSGPEAEHRCADCRVRFSIEYRSLDNYVWGTTTVICNPCVQTRRTKNAYGAGAPTISQK